MKQQEKPCLLLGLWLLPISTTTVSLFSILYDKCKLTELTTQSWKRNPLSARSISAKWNIICLQLEKISRCEMNSHEQRHRLKVSFMFQKWL